MGNFTARGLTIAAEMLVALLIGMSIREYVRASVASRLGDPTPKLWGRISLRPKAWFDPFGSGLVPALIAILWSVGEVMVPAAYAKPAPIDTSYLRRQPRDTVLVSSAGPVANLLLTIVAGLGVRAVGIGPSGANDVLLALVVFAYTNAALLVFHLLPIPGLDGARMVALLLPPTIRDTYRNFDRYLPLVILLALFFLGGLTLTFLPALAGAVCTAAAGVDCRVVLAIG